MKLLNCLSPRKVYNKYLNETVYVSCGCCAACRKRKAQKWVSLLEQEKQMHPYAFFVTLTYDNLHLPLLYPDLSIDNEQIKTGIFDKETRFVSDKDNINIRFKDFVFSEKKDITYFHRVYKLYNGIPYASKKDVQDFNKRLNKYLYEKFTFKFKNFRFFAVSEFGSTTFRPHIHGVYYVDDPRAAQHFAEAVYKCWKKKSLSLGRCDCQLVRGAATNYVAQYLNEFFNYPSFYLAREIRPFYLCSRRPFIGSNQQSDAYFEKTFSSGVTKEIIPSTTNKTSFVAVPLQRFVENKLYPRFSFFDRVTDSLRIRIYSLTARVLGKEFAFNPTKECVNVFIKNVRSALSCHLFEKDLFDYLNDLINRDDDDRLADERLKRLYYISRNFLLNCKRFAISSYCYLKRIVEYYKRKESEKLKRFYELQQEFLNDLSNSLDDLFPAYSELSYASGVPLEQSRLFRDLQFDSKVYLEKKTKSHFKNAYFDKLKVKKNKMYYLISSYNA